MNQYPEFRSIKEKIYGLHSAIMYSMNNELIRIPNSIVTLLRMDEEGHLWFQCKAPVEFIRQYEVAFPVRLHFFKKGYNYFIDVSGSAVVINAKGQEAERNMLLLKMNVNNIEYAEHEAKEKFGIGLLLEKSYKWLVENMTATGISKSLLTKLRITNE